MNRSFPGGSGGLKVPRNPSQRTHRAAVSRAAHLPTRVKRLSSTLLISDCAWRRRGGVLLGVCGCVSLYCPSERAPSSSPFPFLPLSFLTSLSRAQLSSPLPGSFPLPSSQAFSALPVPSPRPGAPRPPALFPLLPSKVSGVFLGLPELSVSRVVAVSLRDRSACFFVRFPFSLLFSLCFRMSYSVSL